ncbi:Tungstate uptake system permease protein TupB [Methanocorpusculaceae archaeon Sp1]|uniref:Tungstate uptake system permease protein TupB n=1 Tax=Methanorbis furvi TaxID=3028299 RepID=A0AAE4SA23_9EURY|nr:Tungstate uptake system permease protein TupB [Methanocorpusculaceae archaeon Sp1]MDV0441846.1 Tungstate uptake system permease protein TupB [Methanocorpusculaceae archaeon Ag1]
MDDIINGVTEAIHLIITMDPEVMEIAQRSLTVSSEATLIAALIAIPLGAAIYYFTFRGKRVVIGTIQTLYALPTVLVGLLVYLLVSNSGPLGGLRFLYTTNAMVLAQVLLVIPIIAGLTIAGLSSLDKEMKYTIQSLNANAVQAIITLCREAKFAILSGVMLAFGRAIAEVGAVMMVGGNIRHFTRTLTTAISLNTSMGEFATSIALGIILLSIALIVNFAMNIIQNWHSGGQKDV